MFKTSIPKKIRLNHFVIILLSALLTNCGLSVGTTSGPGVSPSDARPSGTSIGQGELSGVNGQTVSGTAMIFYSAGTSYTLRLENISVPTETGLSVQVYSSSLTNPVTTQNLGASSGSKNYSFSAQPGTRFSNVYIHSAKQNIIYGTAIIQNVH